MNKAEVVEELQRVARLLDSEYLSRSTFQQHGRISSAGVEATFGSWNEAIVAAGLKPLPQGGMSKDETRRLDRVANPPAAGAGGGRIPDEELLKVARELGRRPSGNQLVAKGKYNPTLYRRRWGSVAAAYKIAVGRTEE